MPESNKRPPDKSFKAGCCEAAIWSETKQEDERSTVQHRIHVQKRYKDKEGAWSSSSSFFPSELPDVLLVILEAFVYTRLRESGESSAT